MTPYDLHIKNESNLLGCCIISPETIDKAVAAGVTAAHFANPLHREQYRLLCELRLAGRDTSSEGIYAAVCNDPGRLLAIGGMGAIILHDIGTTLHAGDYIASILDVHAKRQAYHLLGTALEHIKDGGGQLETVRGILEKAAGVCAGQSSVSRTTRDIARDAIKSAEEQIKGEKASRPLIYTGLPMFDRYATPIEAHEIVVVGARTSHGKTAFMCQVSGETLARDQRVAYFPLETSDVSTLSQIVGQRAGVNIKRLRDEMPDKQRLFLDKLRHAENSKNFMLFDRDMTLSAIEARCRLLATGFKPHLVVLDYLGLIRTDDRDTYQRLTNVSKAMIPLCKMLGCPVMIGAQFSREVEKERREPMRTDFRDAGSVEEDASRIIAIHRRPDQPLDNEWFDGDILQLKMRDGPLTKVPVRFHGATRRFFEVSDATR